MVLQQNNITRPAFSYQDYYKGGQVTKPVVATCENNMLAIRC